MPRQDRRLGVAQLLENAQGILVEHLACLIDGDAAIAAMEQRHTQFVFQRAHLLAQRRLRDEHLAGCP
ncbi:hypothetical protein D3C84_1099690 [compost metagenome]